MNEFQPFPDPPDVPPRTLEAILEDVGLALFSIDLRRQRLHQVSPAVSRVLGISPQDLAGSRALWQAYLLPPELRGQDPLAWEGSGESPLTFEYEVIRADGETRWIHSTLKPARASSGELHRLDGLLTDFTVRKHVEEELSARNLELQTLNRISERTLASPDLQTALPQLLQWILEATGFPSAFMTRLDSERERLVLVGHKGMPTPPGGLVEIPLNETLGGVAVERMKPVAVEDARSHPRYRNDFLRRQKFRSYAAFPLVASDRVLGVLTLADPEVREISMRLLRWGESLANTLASFVERVDAEAALREGEAQALRLARDLQRANEELEAFAYSVSHDLRAPLRTMQGFAHALLQEHGEALPSQARDFARRIIASGRQSEDLIRDLLAYSRMSFEELELQEVSLKQVLSDALEQVEGHIREKDARVSLPHDLPGVRAHHTTMVQVLANLLTNAVKFVPPDRTPEVNIRWEEMEGDQAIRVWVEDNGPGIPGDQLNRIFKAFERLEGGLGSEGTGIGLAIVRRGMQRVGGSVGVESEEGEGSRFWLVIPKSQPRAWHPWRGRRGKGE